MLSLYGMLDCQLCWEFLLLLYMAHMVVLNVKGACTFRPTKKSIFLEKEIQLISLSFDLPWQKEEKQNSETHVPFAFFLNKTKNEFRIMHSFFLFLKETKKEFK